VRKLNRVQGRACAVLRAAAGAGAAELVEQLAARGVDATCVDAIDKDSALHRATRAGHAATVRRLLEIAPNAWPMHRNRFTEVTSEVVVSVFGSEFSSS
jgi:ankyrin repeat protein